MAGGESGDWKYVNCQAVFGMFRDVWHHHHLDLDLLSLLLRITTK